MDRTKTVVDDSIVNKSSSNEQRIGSQRLVAKTELLVPVMAFLLGDDVITDVTVLLPVGVTILIGKSFLSATTTSSSTNDDDGDFVDFIVYSWGPILFVLTLQQDYSVDNTVFREESRYRQNPPNGSCKTEVIFYILQKLVENPKMLDKN